MGKSSELAWWRFVLLGWARCSILDFLKSLENDEILLDTVEIFMINSLC